ncbi:MAG: nucleotide exchange factor GrpE [Bacteroidia bacterium]
MEAEKNNTVKKEEIQNNTSEQSEQTEPTIVENTETVSESRADSNIKNKETEPNNWEEKYNELNDKFLRLYSEFDNYKKRTAKERIEFAKSAAQDVFIAILPVIDDFERAMKSNENLEDINAIKEGLKLIHQKFTTILNKKGLEPMETIGKEFNPDYHEAITNIPAPSEEMKSKVVDEVEKGYLLNGKVIRYAKVVVGT